VAYIEITRPDGRALLPLESDRVTLGKAGTNDVVLEWDGKVSRLHAVLERLSARWCVRDLSSSNGTFVNGERIWAERPLRHGDEIRLGRTRLLFRAEAPTVDAATETELSAPSLTPRERDVLVALCRPLLSGDVFTEPASIREVAEALVVTEAAIKQHLANLYDKFDLNGDEGGRRRVRLANLVVRRGAVSVSDLR
jgi:pSer/pThr/pTyr-binding forkhead associated (FHA) protein